VVDLFFECALCEVRAEALEEVSDAGAGESCDRAAMHMTDGCVVEGGVGVDSKIAGGEHAEVWVDGVVFDGGEGARP
jgi:hypothetical protein